VTCRHCLSENSCNEAKVQRSSTSNFHSNY
jgi:hypothetical protein